MLAECLSYVLCVRSASSSAQLSFPSRSTLTSLTSLPAPTLTPQLVRQGKTSTANRLSDYVQSLYARAVSQASALSTKLVMVIPGSLLKIATFSKSTTSRDTPGTMKPVYDSVQIHQLTKIFVAATVSGKPWPASAVDLESMDAMEASQDRAAKVRSIRRFGDSAIMSVFFPLLTPPLPPSSLQTAPLDSFWSTIEPANGLEMCMIAPTELASTKTSKYIKTAAQVGGQVSWAGRGCSGVGLGRVGVGWV